MPVKKRVIPKPKSGPGSKPLRSSVSARKGQMPKHPVKTPGPGRPKGCRTAPYAKLAVKALHWRVPEGTPPEVVRRANKAWDVIYDIVRGATTARRDQLRAAIALREEVCGAVPKSVHHTGAVTITVADPYAVASEADAALIDAVGALLEDADDGA